MYVCMCVCNYICIYVYMFEDEKNKAICQVKYVYM